MNKTISKADATEALDRIWNYCEEIDNHLPPEEQSGYKMFPDYCIVQNYLVKPTGRWVRTSGYCTPGGDPVWHCSICGKGTHVWGIEAPTYASDVADHQWVTCPNCGAIMAGESW